MACPALEGLNRRPTIREGQLTHIRPRTGHCDQVLPHHSGATPCVFLAVRTRPDPFFTECRPEGVTRGTFTSLFLGYQFPEIELAT